MSKGFRSSLLKSMGTGVKCLSSGANEKSITTFISSTDVNLNEKGNLKFSMPATEP